MLNIFSINFTKEDTAQWAISINGVKLWTEEDQVSSIFEYLGVEDPYQFLKSFTQYGGYVITRDNGPFGVIDALYFVTERAAKEAFAERIEPLLMAAKLRGLIDFEQKNR